MGFVGKWYGFGQNVSYDAGVRAKTRGDWLEAIELFREAHQEQLESSLKSVVRRSLAGALGSQAKILLETDTAEARRLLIEALDLEPKFADLWLARARAERSLGLKNEQMQSLSRALEINAKYAEALIHQAVLQIEGGNSAEAKLSLQQAAQSSPRLAESIRTAGEDPQQLLRLRLPFSDQAAQLIRRGDDLGRQSKWLEAAMAYSEVLALAPGYADVRCRRAEALMALDEFDQAEHELSLALETNLHYAEALAIFGVLRKRQSRSSEAADFLRRALEADPSQPIAREEILRP